MKAMTLAILAGCCWGVGELCTKSVLHTGKIGPLTAIAFRSAIALPVQASEELAKKNNCLACHAADKKLVGPSYKDIAAKYKSDKGAEAKLIDKVKKGGSGVWGQVPMPPNPQVSDADLKTIISYVLASENDPRSHAAFTDAAHI